MEKLPKYLEVYKCVVFTIIAVLLALLWLKPPLLMVAGGVDVENTFPIPIKVQERVEVDGTIAVQR
jgi:hypothetical protein